MFGRGVEVYPTGLSPKKFASFEVRQRSTVGELGSGVLVSEGDGSPPLTPRKESGVVGERSTGVESSGGVKVSEAGGAEARREPRLGRE